GMTIYYVVHKKHSLPLQSISNQELEHIIKKKETGFVYIGRPTCPHCRKLQPIYKEIIKKENMTSFYYNTDVAREDNEDQLIELLSTLSVPTVPTILYIKDGKEVGRLEGDTTKSALLSWVHKYK